MTKETTVDLHMVTIEGESFFKITNSDQMRPFFMSIVSDSNHWMFISSNGGLSAGRKDAENSLFPYYTDDKITESHDITGSKSIFWVKKGDQEDLWEPFSHRNGSKYTVKRNLYKNLYGNKIIFEEINEELEVSFRYAWSSSNRFGFIKESVLTNHSDEDIDVRLLDGIQNIVPYGVTADTQANRSNLVDAYKRNELAEDAGIGIFALSAIIVDRAEPSEALKANIAWSIGLESPTYLLSSLQLDDFRQGRSLDQEVDIKAEKGAYFVSGEIPLAGKADQRWMIIANVNQDANAISEIRSHILSDNSPVGAIEEDIKTGTRRLVDLVAASDGLQSSSDEKRNARHFSNTLFNIMRGGIFDRNYSIEKWDFEKYLDRANHACCRSNKTLLEKLPEQFTVQELRLLVEQSEDPAFTRLSLEYLP